MLLIVNFIFTYYLAFIFKFKVFSSKLSNFANFFTTLNFLMLVKVLKGFSIFRRSGRREKENSNFSRVDSPYEFIDDEVEYGSQNHIKLQELFIYCFIYLVDNYHSPQCCL